MTNKSKNIIIRKIENTKMLFSYGVNVCNVSRETSGNIIITLGKKWDFSITTKKHIYDFLADFGYNVDGKILEKSIENGFLSDGRKTKNHIYVYYDSQME